MAAGLTIRADEVDAFASAFDSAVRDVTKPEDFVPEIDVDGELALDDVTDALLADLDRLEPHGPANPQPIFLARDVTVLSTRVVGQTHLKLALRQGARTLSAIGFGMGDLPVTIGNRIDVLFCAERNAWNGTTTLQLRLRDLRERS
jgi:single-stranded-DNA-specific exonuclease